MAIRGWTALSYSALAPSFSAQLHRCLFGIVPHIFCHCKDSFSVLLSLHGKTTFLAAVGLPGLEMTLLIANLLLLCFALVSRRVLVTHPHVVCC